ncbi:MAG: hypothetical protein HSCHL_1623 [Hydrogenibacillus schlegelii]|uniref:DUF4258 domain-containing protein n=1 Tax=Hydrogenibacillus schlegelii TaxID=1484 RepID=A0A2T5G4C0_HYDSH|nr:DUF4258 domain-containing protein [Hydrogenibacillus schlegelii]PTQ51033.1 MAG: hypothetical protein HSCHL_1623 [Hydrogenibacillus schlegelii]
MEELFRLIHEAVQEQLERAGIPFTGHAKDQLRDRNITEEEVYAALYRNPPHEYFPAFQYPYGPKPFSNKDPVFSVIDETSNLVVAVAIEKRPAGLRFRIVTIFRASEKSRHRRKRR